jgi:hypothetical protein
MIRFTKVVKSTRFKLKELSDLFIDKFERLMPNRYSDKKNMQNSETKKSLAKSIIKRKVFPDYERSGYENFCVYFADHQEYWRGVCEGLGIDFKYLALDDEISHRVAIDRVLLIQDR